MRTNNPQVTREEFLNSLKSDPGTYSEMPEGPKRDLDDRIREHARSPGGVQLIEGVFGDYRGAGGYVEGVRQTKDGPMTKIYGCSTLYHGEVIGATIDSVAITKGVFMETARLFSKFPFYLALSLFLLPAGKRRIIEWAARVCFKDLTQRYPVKFKRGVRELIRVGEKHFKPVEIGDTKVSLVKCVAMFLEDNAYWFPLQDALSNLDRTNEPIDEVRRLFDLCIERQTFEPSKAKYRLLRKMALFCLHTMPSVRRAVGEMMIDLDLKEIKPDESDIYFTLNRRDYNYRGESHAERLKKWNELNEKAGNIILNL